MVDGPIALTDADIHGRRLLRQRGNVQMSQESVGAPRGRQSFRYFVGPAEGPTRSFDTPHDAWEHFETLTNAREKRRPGVTNTVL
jgi:hypothetical protein